MISGDVELSSACIASSKLYQYTIRISKYSTVSESDESRRLQISGSNRVFLNKKGWLGYFALVVKSVMQTAKQIKVSTLLARTEENASTHAQSVDHSFF